MGTYPCSNCGSSADTGSGCPSCGRTLDAEILSLDATISNMQRRSALLKEDRIALMGRLQGAITIREVLIRAAGRHEGTVQTPKLSRIIPVPGKARPMDMPVKTGRRPRAATAPPDVPTQAGASAPAPPKARSQSGPSTGTPTGAPPRVPTQSGSPGAARQPAAGSAAPAHPPPHQPETSRRANQQIVLGIGAVVAAIAVVLTPFFYSGASELVRGLVLTGLTVLAISAPIGLIKLELLSTSEWISPLGLLMILLDGEEIWSAGVRHSGMSATTYAGLVMIVAAGFAVLYQRVTGLAVPRFATTVLVQPIPALLLFHWLTDLTAWAAVFTMLAAADLVIALRTHRQGRHGRRLRAAVRTLQEVVNGGALIIGGIALAHADGAAASIRSGAPVVAAAVIALAAGLLFRKWPLPDVSAGVATLAAIGGFGRMGALVLPGWGLTATAIAVAACSIGVYALPKYAQTGAQIAGGTAATVTVLIVVLRGSNALRKPLTASAPAWHADLSKYVSTVSHGAGRGTGQLVTATLLLAIAAAIMLPRTWRRSSLVIGIALAAILAPGSWHLPWPAAILIGLLVTLALGADTLLATNSRESWIGIGAAFAVGAYTAGIACARPGGQALFLGALTLGAVGLASAGAVVVRARGLVPSRRAIEASWGAAAFALPGAIAAITALPAPHGAIVPEAVIAAAFVAVAGTLTVAAITQVALRRSMPLLVGGAAAGALVTALAAGRTHELARADVVVAFMLLVSGLMLMLAPVLNTGFGSIGFGGWRLADLDGEELAAAVVTCAAIVALARVAALVAPGASLVIVAALVTIVAAGTRSLQESWRRGPVLGGGVVGVIVLATGAYAAFDVAVTSIRINRPVWHAKLPGWSTRLATETSSLAHGPQAAFALILMAVAAWIVLTDRAAAIAIAATLGMAALLLPAPLHTGWWGGIALSGIGATAAGVAAALSRDPVVALARAGIATLLFANTIAASLVKAETTATTLVGSALVCAVVTAVAARTIRAIRADGDPAQPTGHLVIIGGGALAGAILTLAGGLATVAASTGATLTVILAAGMAGLAIALTVLVPVATRLEPLLAQASIAISAGGLGLALASFANFTTAGVFAAVAALLAVLAEVTRSAVNRRVEIAAGAGADPGHRGSSVGFGTGWFPQRTEVLLAAGPATVLAIASVAGSLIAALVGPYHWLGMIWRGAPHAFKDQLGPLTSWVGAPIGILTAVLLTAMAVVGAIGFGGDRAAVTTRAVAVVTPGIAICLLIAPYLLRAQWPAEPLTALAVATMSGLALALTELPPDIDPASPLRFARRFVLMTCILASGSGIAGSLPTRQMTLVALTAATLTGLVTAFFGRSQIGRVTGWIVAAASGELLAFAAIVSSGLPRYQASFAIGGVAAVLLIIAAQLPRMQLPENQTENLTIEVSAYAGAVFALVLASESIAHLAVFLGAWGAVLGIATARPQRPPAYRSALMWTAAAHELAAWFLLMTYARVGIPEAYTLGIAVIALVTGWIELRWHPELTSWVTYGIALAAALGPSLVIVIVTNGTTERIVLLLIGSTAVLLVGAVRRQQAPTIIGAIALLGVTINLVARYSTTILVLVLLVLIAGVLIGVGANFEKQRNNLTRAWSAFNKMQ